MADPKPRGGFAAGAASWLDRNVLELGREMRVS